ncbi:MAG TPA: Fe-S cluster assembly protein IscX [Terriglobales bacterium]|nr:Fe-S cluster assembly protein IscX [Terriglobales bacterium]
MTEELRWDDTDELAVALAEKYPDINPREVRLRELCVFVSQLPIFADDPEATNEDQLQTIQDAWYEEYLDRRKSA